jgi:hypothetical protein
MLLNTQSRFEKLPSQNQQLLDSIKGKLTELERLEPAFRVMYEDGIYRLYHYSFKVYQLQDFTLSVVRIFKTIGKDSDSELCDWFEQIVADGTSTSWEGDHNQQWLQHTRPIVEAFLHAKYFLEMMIKYGRELDSAPNMLPSGWAAILELYNQR